MSNLAPGHMGQLEKPFMKNVVHNIYKVLLEPPLFQDLICSVSDVMEPKRTNTVRVAITVTELLRHHVPRNNNSAV